MAEYLGEQIADFVGITTPVYQYEIEEYYRMKEEVHYYWICFAFVDSVI